MDQSKLAMARQEKGLNQEDLAEAVSVDVSTISRWENGETVPRGYNRQKLCTFFGKSAKELGLDGSDKEDQIVLPINTACKTLARDPVTRLFHLAYIPLCSYQEVRDKMAQILSEGITMDTTTRRDILIGALHGLVGLPLATGVLHGSQYEAILRRCTAAIAACYELAKSTEAEDLSRAFEGVSAYLPILDTIAKEVPQFRQEALDLAARSAFLKATLGWHCQGVAEAIQYAKTAKFYSKEAGDICLELNAYTRLVWAYFYSKQDMLAFTTAREAVERLLQYEQDHKARPVSSYIQSRMYSALAVMAAKNGRTTQYLGKAADASLETIMDFTQGALILNDGMTQYYQRKYKQAQDSLEQLIDPITLKAKLDLPERSRIEALNIMTTVSAKAKDRNMEKALHFWVAGIQGAKALRSEQRFTEAVAAYDIMEAAWPDEPRITELRELTQHW